MYKNIAKKKKHFLFDKVKCVLRVFKKKHQVIYLGDKVERSSIVLSNHVGASGPLSWELYPEFPFRFWGTFEMNSDFKTMYHYLSKIYFHQKKHWPLWISRIFCLIATPVMKGMYKGLEVISTYSDMRLKGTIGTSVEVLKEGHNIVIFPEDSSHGYFDKMTKFFPGFLLLAKTCYRNGIDTPIYVAYYSKAKKKMVIDKPIKYSELIKKYEGLSFDDIAQKMLERCNQLVQDIISNKY